MKNLFLIVVLLMAACTLSLSQAFYQEYATALATDTLGTNVTAYSQGQRVAGDTPNKIMLVTPYPRRNAAIKGCYIFNAVLEMDSTCPGSFIAFAMKDSAGMGVLLSTNKTASQMRDAMGDNYLTEINFSTTALGTWAAGARRTRGYAQWFWSCDFADISKDRIYWILVADGAYTPKANGVIRLWVSMRSK